MSLELSTPLTEESPVLVPADTVHDNQVVSLTTSYASLYVGYQQDKRHCIFDVTIPHYSQQLHKNDDSSTLTSSDATDTSTAARDTFAATTTNSTTTETTLNTTTMKFDRLVPALNALAAAGFLLAQDELDRLLAYCHPNDASLRANGQKCFFLLTKCPQVNVVTVV